MSFTTVLDRLTELDLGPSTIGWDGNVTFRCPAHDDRSPSASVKEGDDGKVLLHCHAGCDVNDIVDALGLKLGDLFSDDEPKVVAEYTYRDANDNPVIKVERLEPGPDGKKKSFRQSHWNGTAWTLGLADVERPLYNLPEVLAADYVWVVEGEKDADRLNAELEGEGLVATTNLGGSGKWLDSWTEALRGKYVTIIADVDEPGKNGKRPGEEHARRIQEALPHARILYPAAGKDISDHLDAGLMLDDLRTQRPLAAPGFTPVDTSNIPPPRRLLYEPFLYERALTWLWGPSGHGKSMVLDKAMADLSREGASSCLWDWESPEMEADRLGRLGADMGRVHLFSPVEGDVVFDFGTEGFAERVIDTVRYFGAQLVVFNPFFLAAGEDAKATDSWNAPVRSVVATCRRIIEETGASVVVIDHQDDPTAERAHGGKSKKWLADLYLRVTQEAGEYVPGQPYRMRITSLKQSREYLPPIVGTVIGDHQVGALQVWWQHTSPPQDVVEGDDPGTGDANAKVSPSTAPLPLMERIALRRLEEELGATEVAE